MKVRGSVDLIIRMATDGFDHTLIACEIETDGILGQDFLKQYVDSINYKRSCLVMGKNVVPFWTGGQANQICRVQLNETVKLPPYLRTMVSVEIPLKEHVSPIGMIKPSFDLMAHREMCVMGGLIDYTSGLVNLNLLNYGPSDVTVFKNTNLEICES
ncbi:hypothetical protein DPMN_104947 [Dreissena polymorpha]|uniref:Uncharacterized protein n=1 Tax=Dreissena polymorpha TaxID=45954 RepID=A0A9D4HG78_DREPO|nr:hypothetical protein DPMN_104947 [Dreissena polymorpha]